MAIGVLLLSFLLFSYVQCDEVNVVETLCSKLPYPEPCSYFLKQEQAKNPTKIATNFLAVAQQLALVKAREALNAAYTLGPKCGNAREKAAWEDCVELYENTVDQLIVATEKCSKVDKQTWLSTALTNMETCKTGLREMRVADFIYPLMSNNVSYLVSNSLALSKVSPPKKHSLTDSFPKWLKAADRRLLQSNSASSSADFVVSADGSGKFKTINDAVAAAAKSGGKRVVIYVKTGVYNERVIVPKGAKNIMMVGDGIGKTIITGSRSAGGGSTTFNSATVGVVGNGFMLRGITVRNTAGAKNHQAVALRSGSDLSVFYQCSFEGYQDTLYVLSQRQFYKNCDIYGTVDFIFGNAAVVLQTCNIYARLPPAGTNTITAQGRTDPNQNTGISIHQCRITAAPDLKSAGGKAKTFLGRPWKAYSRTVVMNSFLDGIINPAGWYPWTGSFALNTLFYGEYSNTGPGSSTSNRVKWKGYRVITSSSVASQFTVDNFIGGRSWLPNTGVPFIAGLN